MDNGCIGEVVPTSSKEEPESKESSLMVNEINFVHEVQSVDCGKEHVLLLTTTAKVFSFGGGSRGQQGNGCLEAQITPQLVEALDGIEITQITCGGWHSAVISNSGDVYCWGWNKDGQVGVTDTEGSQSVQIQAVPFPLTFSDNSDVIVVSASAQHNGPLSHRTIGALVLGDHGPPDLGDHGPLDLGDHGPLVLGDHGPLDLGDHGPLDLGDHGPLEVYGPLGIPHDHHQTLETMDHQTLETMDHQTTPLETMDHFLDLETMDHTTLETMDHF
ncbi:hypothetical protein QZH41_002948 [Actinostola sp. cb2023]|nr:hypothetical protein QZH41_002948 [Actinostola sp. cb2023]